MNVYVLVVAVAAAAIVEGCQVTDYKPVGEACTCSDACLGNSYCQHDGRGGFACQCLPCQYYEPKFGQCVDKPAATTTTASSIANTTVPITSPTKAPTIRPVTVSTRPPTIRPVTVSTRPPTIRPVTVSTRPPTIRPVTVSTRPPTIRPVTVSTRPPTIRPVTVSTRPPTIRPVTVSTRPPTIRPVTVSTRPPTIKPTTDATKAPTNASTTASAAVCINNQKIGCEDLPNGDYPACFPWCQTGIFITCSNGYLYVRDCALGWYVEPNGHRFTAKLVYDPYVKRCERKTLYCPRPLDNEIEQK